ncbi:MULTISPECIES: hypothetical protein [Xanthomonas]|uniref:Uncharacterized protein n=1 Tax=Xanthomonas rydalmerensis TaxID=3046274 RepID=A0ABZ0JRA4_9XANT|nr:MULTISPECIES: hypothetical protein [unclassified Xanthomonas]MBB5875786.1 hypothetical protein [Xanthomonas sp. 3498]MBB5943147.1 hypothetical protein [Xanthomonas sp. 3307]WOS42369.1 hypothetical protein QN243_08005 [Xanthomonas sp. DM-2023]WOS46555.1 hypothetical protein QN242_08005 [Xanthomonas sp. DM-2023]WOS50735.1 hypothetical protein QN240_08005 [Xanthomonas sp. DM-2023]
MAKFDATTPRAHREKEGAGNGAGTDLLRATEDSRGRATSAEENGI